MKFLERIKLKIAISRIIKMEEVFDDYGNKIGWKGGQMGLVFLTLVLTFALIFALITYKAKICQRTYLVARRRTFFVQLLA